MKALYGLFLVASLMLTGSLPKVAIAETEKEFTENYPECPPLLTEPTDPQMNAVAYRDALRNRCEALECRINVKKQRLGLSPSPLSVDGSVENK